MSPIEDARELAEDNPVYAIYNGGGSTYFCVYCDLGDPHWKAGGFKHNTHCPWLSLPKIVVVLEAADRAIDAERRKYPRRFLPDGHPLSALAEALYGRPTAIVTKVVPSSTT